jgi:hypothetical protein
MAAGDCGDFGYPPVRLVPVDDQLVVVETHVTIVADLSNAPGPQCTGRTLLGSYDGGTDGHRRARR